MKLKAAVAIGALVVGASAMQVAAQDLRWRTINVIVPVGAGGGSDTYARTILPVMADCLGTNVAVRNVPGDGHLLGIGQAHRSNPDGHTITVFNLPAIPITQLSRGEDAQVDIRDMTYVGTYGSSTLVLYAHPEAAENIDDLMALYEGGESVIGAQDRVGGGEVITHVMRDQWGLDWQELVVYDGGAQLVAAILRQEVPGGVTTDASGQSAVGSGQLLPIASLGAERSPLYPDVPTAEEQGYEDLSALGFWLRTVAAPPGMDEERLAAMEACLEEAVNSDQIQEWSENTGNPVMFVGAEATSRSAAEAFRIIGEIPNFDEIAGN
ncbi:tripartite tricarboxylate transporter substrate binding protein [Rhodobacteraceae bacterium 2376]|uniref:Tripartite tricarboxylate transporter substrate binding protein n=1 Tax=Rhabdonatronobacter sediminivivens TaxID=2743469 RepID=A0A7Z0HYK4_9RHOB|nr:tripartite tricarboxylate transporter substrate binding protein [Rhabdonatronobacter sediminivivens]NYS24269.1 tripartite tricarboxylate transporter substrate binding protein [Rhabdonatronobacter sediminivivens]